MQKSKFTKLLCLVLSLLMILGAAPITAFAADTSLTGFSGGDGTESNPYRIASKTELENLANIVNGGNNCAGTYFVLTADIGTETDPVTTFIGDYDNAFGGHFDGAGFTVTMNIEIAQSGTKAILEANLIEAGLEDSDIEMVLMMTEMYIENPDMLAHDPDAIEHLMMDLPPWIELDPEKLLEWLTPVPPLAAGIFCKLMDGGEIRDVISAGKTNSEIAGSVCGTNYGTIIDCKNTATVYGLENSGGVCAHNYGTLIGCFNIANLSGSSSVGGVCGINYGTLNGCFNIANLSGINSIGGVCAHNYGTITKCYNTGNITGSNGIGGVCGISYKGSTCSDSYNNGPVNGENEYAGICGTNEGKITDCYNTAEISGLGTCGGVAGWARYCTIIGCYNVGDIYGSGNVGGVIGNFTHKSTCINSYNTGTVRGDNNVGGVIGSINQSTSANCYNLGSVSATAKAAGGLCGCADYMGVFLNSYSIGEVTAAKLPGGVYGWIPGSGSCSNCYYYKDACADNGCGTGLTTEQMQAVTGTDGALVDLLNGYIDDNSDTTEDWARWTNTAGTYPTYLLPFVYSAENNVLSATRNDGTSLTLTLTENGTISAEEISAWEAAGLTVPEIVLDAAANTAIITVNDATATITLAEGTLKTHSVKVICGADADGKSYITDIMAGTDVTVIAGTFEGKLFEKWISELSIDGSTDETVTFRMPNEDVTVEAEFVDCYSLSVFDGTTLTSEPQKVNYTATVEAPAAPEGMRFKNWTAEGITLTDSTASVLEFSMPANAVMLTANYIAPRTVTVEGGTITNAGTSAQAFAGDTISITADADNNDSRFTQWSSETDITFADKTAKTTTFTMPEADVIISAKRGQSYTVTVSGGSASGLNDAGKAFPGDIVTITADADTNDSRFTEWSSETDITFADKTAKTTTFTMPEAAVSVEAEREQSYTVTVTDGKVSGLNSAGKAFAGQTITVTANNIIGHNFTGWTGEGVEFDNAANTTTTFTMPEGNVTVKANYEQIKVTPPTAGTKTYTYNGTAQTYEFASVGDVSYYSLKNNTQTNAGTYTVKAHLIDGAVWTDGTTADKEFTFVIARKTIDKPQYYNTKYYYNGTEQQYILCKQIDSSYYYYESTIPAGSVNIRGNTRTDAGEQAVMVTPTSNYCWPDGTRDTVIFSFVINRYPIPTLFDDPRSFTYNGKPHKYTPFVMSGSSLYDFDGLYYDLSNRTKTAAGNYTVTATLKDNFCWYDGSTAPRNMTFQIKEDEIDSYIYYVRDLKTGDITANVDISYTEFDNISALKGFSNHPKFKEDMLKDRYMPVLRNAPDGATATFYIKDNDAPVTMGDINKSMKWDNVKMSDLKPDTIYYIFATVSCPGYKYSQLTDVSDLACFLTSIPQIKLVTAKLVTEEDINEEYQSNVIDCIFNGGASSILNTFSTRKVKTTTTVKVKTEYFYDLDEALAQGTRDIDEGLDYVVAGFEVEGKPKFMDMTADNVADYKRALNSKGVLSSPKRMLAAPLGDPDEIAPLEIGAEVSGEPAEFTPEFLNTMFTIEQFESLILDNEEFKVKKDLGLASEQTEAKNAALLERLEAAGLIATTEAPDYYTSTVTVSSLLYDPETGCVDGENSEYRLDAGELLPADAVKEIEGYTFDGLYYKDIFDFEKEAKSAEATGDHGMILTQGLVKWDPETDYATRDLDLLAIYVKDGAEEPVSYKADGTTFLDEGSEAVITLPILPDGMTYGDVVNDNADIIVSAINDGKVTVTLTNDVTGDEPFTFTVAVNSNIDGIEDPIYYVIVTVNAVDEAEVKEEAKTAVEALANEDDSDEVTAIIEKALEDIENAISIDAVDAIVADAKKAVADQKAAEEAAVLAAAKEEAKAAIDAAIEADDSDDVKAAAEEAKAAIDAATTIEAVEAAKAAGLEKMSDASGACPYCGQKEHKNWIDKLFCIIKRIIRVIELFFGLVDDVNALC